MCDKEFDVTRKCVVFLKHFDHFFLKVRAIVDHRLRKSRSLFPSSRLAFYIRDRIRDPVEREIARKKKGENVEIYLTWKDKKGHRK